MKIANIRSYLYGAFQGILERGRTGDLAPFGTSEKLDAVVERVVAEGVVWIDPALVDVAAKEDPVLFTDSKRRIVDSVLEQMRRK
jgi:hypothetical protein